MLKSVEGIYRNGKVELKESPANIAEEVSVIVTFVDPCEIDLPSRGIGRPEAGKLRDALAAFDDWIEPGMAIYDDYESAKSNL